MLSKAIAYRESDAEAKIRKEMEDIRLRLHNMIQGDESRFGRAEVHRLSRELDALIVRYMRRS